MDTTTPTVYTVSPDAHGDPTLWRGTAAEPYAHAVAMKCELDRLDPVLWPTLVAALVPPPPYSATDVGKRIRFPHTGSVYRVTAVDEQARTLSFCVPRDPEDEGTETWDDLVAVDAVVLR